MVESQRIIVFAERMLPSTQTFIPAQVNMLQSFSSSYVGLLPAAKNIDLGQKPILLRSDRSTFSRVAPESYRWIGVARGYHAQLRALRASLIHAHFAEGGPPALFLSKQLNLPLILHLHGGAELMTDADLLSRWFEWPFLAHRHNLWRRASAFLCVSEYSRRCALKAGFPQDKLHVHFAGLDFKAFAPKLPVAERDHEMILFIGRLIEYKGCDYLIRAMQLVQRQRPGAHLVVIGDGECRARLELLAKSLQIKCEFLGQLKPVELHSWLDKARVLCGPSVTLPDGQSEAFGIVFLEAQSMGVPVVSFRHGGIPETMREGVTGLLADEGDVHDLANQLLRYLNEDSFWSQSREQGMQWVRRNFDNGVQAAKLEDIYHRVIRGFSPYEFAQSLHGARDAA
jgi:colanic acid/amylovoran biosynthesis glycosyltransferase